jgi:hypothetical protein
MLVAALDEDTERLPHWEELRAGLKLRHLIRYNNPAV